MQQIMPMGTDCPQGTARQDDGQQEQAACDRDSEVATVVVGHETSSSNEDKEHHQAQRHADRKAGAYAAVDQVGSYIRVARVEREQCGQQSAAEGRETAQDSCPREQAVDDGRSQRGDCPRRGCGWWQRRV